MRQSTSSALNRRSGFTLIEMLAATVVISMLLVALVGISRASARQAKRARELRTQFPSTAILEEQLTRDIRNADGFSSLGNGFTLFGAIASNPATGNGTHSLARVTYAIRNTGGLKVLVRSEQTQRGVGHQRVVWIGAGSLSLSAAGTASDQQVDLQRTGRLSPMPSSFSLQFTGANGESILNQRIRHHMEIHS